MVWADSTECTCVRACMCLWHWGDVGCVSVEGGSGGCSTSLLHYIVPCLCKILARYVCTYCLHCILALGIVGSSLIHGGSKYEHR